MSKICIIPKVDGLAGGASFRLKFEDGLRARGVDVTRDLTEPADATLVLAGTPIPASVMESSFTRTANRATPRRDQLGSQEAQHGA